MPKSNPVVQEDHKARKEIVAGNTSVMNRLIDHTVLAVDTSPEQIRKLCAEAVEHKFRSVCVPPCYVKLAKELLGKDNTDVVVCTVVGFPNGYSEAKVKSLEAKTAVLHGAREVDFVQNVTLVKRGEWDALRREFETIVKRVHKVSKRNNIVPRVVVKVILETALLTEEEVARSTREAVLAGVDIVKTSTGFSTRGASIRDMEIMAESIQRTRNEFGFVKEFEVGIKASGKVATRDQALELIKAGATRIGASRGIELIKAPVASAPVPAPAKQEPAPAATSAPAKQQPSKKRSAEELTNPTPDKGPLKKKVKQAKRQSTSNDDKKSSITPTTPNAAKKEKRPATPAASTDAY